MPVVKNEFYLHTYCIEFFRYKFPLSLPVCVLIFYVSIIKKDKETIIRLNKFKILLFSTKFFRQKNSNAILSGK